MKDSIDFLTLYCHICNYLLFSYNDIVSVKIPFLQSILLSNRVRIQMFYSKGTREDMEQSTTRIGQGFFFASNTYIALLWNK